MGWLGIWNSSNEEREMVIIITMQLHFCLKTIFYKYIIKNYMIEDKYESFVFLINDHDKFIVESFI